MSHFTWDSCVTSSHHKREENTHRMKELHSHLEETVQAVSFMQAFDYHDYKVEYITKLTTTDS